MKRITALLLATLLLLAACGQLSGDVLTFKTADPNVALSFKLLPPAPPVTIEPSVLPTITPTPCELVIKGNIAADGTRIAHSPGQANYGNTVIDEAKGEKWFCTIEEAVAEGWRAAQR